MSRTWQDWIYQYQPFGNSVLHIFYINNQNDKPLSCVGPLDKTHKLYYALQSVYIFSHSYVDVVKTKLQGMPSREN